MRKKCWSYKQNGVRFILNSTACLSGLLTTSRRASIFLTHCTSRCYVQSMFVIWIYPWLTKSRDRKWRNSINDLVISEPCCFGSGGMAKCVRLIVTDWLPCLISPRISQEIHYLHHWSLSNTCDSTTQSGCTSWCLIVWGLQYQHRDQWSLLSTDFPWLIVEDRVLIELLTLFSRFIETLIVIHFSLHN